jgi:hypothetical protein
VSGGRGLECVHEIEQKRRIRDGRRANYENEDENK